MIYQFSIAVRVWVLWYRCVGWLRERRAGVLVQNSLNEVLYVSMSMQNWLLVWLEKCHFWVEKLGYFSYLWSKHRFLGSLEPPQ